MIRESTYKGKMGDWDRLNTMLTANTAELPQLEPLRAQLAASLTQAQAIAAQQAIHTAGKQETSQQLRTAITEGERLANLLRKGLQHHYGIRSEKLIEFGVKPFRGRLRAEPPTSPAPAGGPEAQTTGSHPAGPEAAK
jgi:hypothetical protein